MLSMPDDQHDEILHQIIAIQCNSRTCTSKYSHAEVDAISNLNQPFQSCHYRFMAHTNCNDTVHYKLFYSYLSRRTYTEWVYCHHFSSQEHDQHFILFENNLELQSANFRVLRENPYVQNGTRLCMEWSIYYQQPQHLFGRLQNLN